MAPDREKVSARRRVTPAARGIVRVVEEKKRAGRVGAAAHPADLAADQQPAVGHGHSGHQCPPALGLVAHEKPELVSFPGKLPGVDAPGQAPVDDREIRVVGCTAGFQERAEKLAQGGQLLTSNSAWRAPDGDATALHEPQPPFRHLQAVIGLTASGVVGEAAVHEVDTQVTGNRVRNRPTRSRAATRPRHRSLPSGCLPWGRPLVDCALPQGYRCNVPMVMGSNPIWPLRNDLRKRCQHRRRAPASLTHLGTAGHPDE